VTGLRWLRRHWWPPLVALLAVAVMGFSTWAALGLAHDRNQRRAASEHSRLYLCEKSNELPIKIARVLALAQPIVPTTTTTIPIADEELRQRDAERRRQLAEALKDLGRVDDCRKVVAGDVPVGPTTSVP
jgi:hypothetical protein